MKLYELLEYCEDELTCWDKDIDVEVYFYIEDKDMKRMSQVIDVVSIRKNGIVIDISGLIERKMDELKKADLFNVYTVEAIVSDFDSILAGFVTEKWMEKFVDILCS